MMSQALRPGSRPGVSTRVTEASPRPEDLREPWRVGRGPFVLWRDRSLLYGLTRRLRVARYQGTVLGRVWDFIDPIVMFSVYFLVIGVLLGLSRSVENFPLYIFSGLVTVQLFNSALTQSTTVLTRSRILLRRVAIPPQLLTASQVWNSMLNIGPALLILLIASIGFGIIYGYEPHAETFLIAAGGVVLLVAFTLGLGLVLGVADVFIRDTRHVVSVITTLTRWVSPVIYPWTLVPEKLGDGLLTTLYLSNPITIAMFGVREAFWAPTVETGLPPIPLQSVIIGVLLTVLVLGLGFALQGRYRDRIVQRLRWTS